MKKILVITALFSLGLFPLACGGNPTSPAPTVTPSPTRTLSPTSTATYSPTTLSPTATFTFTITFTPCYNASLTPCAYTPVPTPTVIGTDDLHLKFTMPSPPTNMGVRVTDTTASVVVANRNFGMSTNEFSIYFPKVITVGHAYTMDVWLDGNSNGTWDAPPTDGQWAAIPITASATGYTVYWFIYTSTFSSIGGFNGGLFIPSGAGDYEMLISGTYASTYPGTHTAVARVTDTTVGADMAVLKFDLAGAYRIRFESVLTNGHYYNGDFLLDADSSGTCNAGDDGTRFNDTTLSGYIAHTYSAGSTMTVCPLVFPAQ